MATASSTGSRWSATPAFVSVAAAAILAAAHARAAVKPIVPVAAAGCTQEDMRALVLDLPSTAGALSIEIAGAPRPGARRLTLSPLRRDPATPTAELARATIRHGDGVEWLRGTLVLDSVEPGVGVSGSYDFHRADAAPLRARFKTRWSDAKADCG